MAGLRASAKPFATSYGERVRELLELAGSSLEGLSPGAVHDLRVAARRVQMLCRLLPKDLRTSERCKMFNTALGSLLKATSGVRDLDTLAQTLERRGTSLPQGLFSILDEERTTLLRRAMPTIRGVSEALPVTFKPSQIDSKKLSKRLRERVDKRGGVVVGLLGKVLGDESKIGELHALRKETKKLRYLLELADKSPRELSVLAAWQERLGTIHDFDVAIDYLRRSRLDFPKQKAIAELMRTRHLRYRGFAREGKRDTAGVLKASTFLAPRYT